MDRPAVSGPVARAGPLLRVAAADGCRAQASPGCAVAAATADGFLCLLAVCNSLEARE